MDRPQRILSWLPGLLLALVTASCGTRHPALKDGLVAAIAALPWDLDSTGTGAFCSRNFPCDTLLVEPRVVRLHQLAPAFFLPAARPLLLDLAALPGFDFRATGRPVRLADWRECVARRHDATWPREGHACLALAVAEGSAPSDTVQLALLVISPLRGLTWPRLQLIPVDDRWRVEVVSVAGE